MSATLSKWWENTKAFFKNSETILYARLQVLSGFFLAVFSSVDWTTVTANFNNARESLYIAFGLIANGVVTELLRRRNMNA
jgi:hypothetical protein